MALSITGGASSYQLREPSVLNTPNAHRQLLNGFQLNDSAQDDKTYTLVIDVGSGAEIQLADGSTLADGTTVTTLTNSGSLDFLNTWLDTLYLAAQDVELGNNSVNDSGLKFTFSSDEDAAIERPVSAIITPSNDPTTIPVALELVVDEATTEVVDGTPNNGAHTAPGAPDGVLKIRDPEVGIGSQQPSQIIYRVESVPEHGFLKLGTTVLGIGSVFTHQDVIDGKVKYEHTSRGPTENDNDSFEVTVNDGATSVDWSNTNARSIINITVTPTNQPPEAENASGYVYENQPHNWDDAYGSSSVGHYITAYAGVDGTRNDRDPGDALTIIITEVPENGDLYFDFGTGPRIVEVGDKIPYDQKAGITYGHSGDDPDTPAKASDTFKFVVRDSGDGVDGDGNPINPLTSDPATVNLAIRPVNDIPTFTGPTEYPGEVPDTLKVDLRDILTGLDVADTDTPRDQLFFVLETGPDSPEGWIYIDNGPGVDPTIVPPGGRIPLSLIDDGKVYYQQHDKGGADEQDVFTFKIVDNAVSPRWDENGDLFTVPGGVYPGNTPEDGNTFDDLQPFTLTFNLNTVNGGEGWGPEFPQVEHNEGSSGYAGPKFGNSQHGWLQEDGWVVLGDGVTGEGGTGRPGLFYQPEIDGEPVDPSSVIYTITGYAAKVTPGSTEPDNTENGEWNGALQRYVGVDDPLTDSNEASWVSLHRWSTFTQEELNAGVIRFRHDGGEDFHSQVTFSVSSGYEQAPWVQSFEFFIQPINDDPEATGSGVHLVREGYQADNPVYDDDVTTPDDRSFYITTEHLSFDDPDHADSSYDYLDLETEVEINDKDNFAIGDRNDPNNKDPLKFQVTKLPTGVLEKWNGTAWVAVELNEILDASLITGLKNNYEGDVPGGTGLRYYHKGDEATNEAPDFFTVVAIDRWGGKSDPADVKFLVTPVNDPPEIQKTPNHDPIDGRWPDDNGIGTKNNPLFGSEELGNIFEGSQNYYKITAEHLQAVDADSDANQVQYRISQLPDEGRLFFNSGTDANPVWEQLGVNSSFTQQQVTAGKIFYGKHDGTSPESTGEKVNGVWVPPHDKFVFILSDGTSEQIAREFWIYVDPTNDAPVVTAGGAALLIPQGGVKVGGAGFTVTDQDQPQPNWADHVRVTIRLSNDSGQPLTAAQYVDGDDAPIFKLSSTGTGVTQVGAYDGNGKALVVEGTLANVQAYIDNLHLAVTGGPANADGYYRVDVIVDDRLRNTDGTVKEDANGGKNLTNDGTNTEAPSTLIVDPYTTTRNDIETGELRKNVDINHRRVFLSNENQAPTANADENWVSEVLGFPVVLPVTATGNVIKADGPWEGNAIAAGDKADTDPELPFDVLTVTKVVFGTTSQEFPVGQDYLEIDGAYGTLKLFKDGTYHYTLNNNLPAVKALTDTTTRLNELFTYTITDDDKSTGGANKLTAQSTLTIIITGVEDGPPTIVAEDHNGDATGQNTVYERGLPARPDNPGSKADSNDESTSTDPETLSVITVTAEAGIKTITITDVNDNPVTLDVDRLLKLDDPVSPVGGTGPVTIETEKGTLKLVGFAPETGFDPESELALYFGEIQYIYTLKDNHNHSGTEPVTDKIPLAVEDHEGDTAEGTLTILIVDDVPQAEADFAKIKEDAVDLNGNPVDTINGHVLEVDGHGSVEDVFGADGKAAVPVIDVKFQPDPANPSVVRDEQVGTEFSTNYGKIKLNGDGTYSYWLDNNNQDVNALKTGETLTEVIHYTIVDSDGSTSSTTLTITIEGNTDNETEVPDTNILISALPREVDERGLTSDTDDSEFFTDGEIFVRARDGIRDVTVGGVTLTAADLLDLSPTATKVIETDQYILTLVGFEVEEELVSADGTRTLLEGNIQYEYVLKERREHPLEGEEDEGRTGDYVFDLFGLEVTDLNRVPASAKGELKIGILDDVPQAYDDVATVREDKVLVATGNVVLGTQDPEGVLQGKDSPGADGLKGNPVIKIVFNGEEHAPGDTIQGKYGSIVIQQDGSYVYTLDNDSPLVQALNQGQRKAETFTYTIIDNDGDKSTADLVVTIIGTYDPPKEEPQPEKPVNKAPEVILPVDPRELERFDVDSRDIIPVDVTKYFRDPEGEKLVYEIEGLPTSLLFDPETGEITGAPHHRASQFGPHLNGVYEVTVIATDPHGEKASFSFQWTIANQPPYAKDDVARTSPTQAVSGNVIRGDDRGYGRDGDPDQDPFIVSYINNTGVGSNGASIKGSNGGTFTVQRDGSYTFNPGSDFSGLGSTETRETSITYTIADSDGGTSRATLTVTVAGKDAPPPQPGPQPIIPGSEVITVLTVAPPLGPDGTPYSTPGTPGKVDEIQSDFSVRLAGGAENVVLTGNRAANVWDNASSNVIYGNAAANTVFLSGGRDVVDGGAGYDLLVLSKARSDYTFDFSKGVAEIRDNATGVVVTAAGIEAVSFNGQAVDPVRALYDAYYGRAATEGEYASATTLLKDGVSVADVAAKLAATPESQAHVGSGSGIDFVKSVYGAVLGRGADDAEAAWWAGRIEDGEFSRAEAVTRFLDSDEFADRYVSLFLTDHSDIFGLYRIVLGRDPDKDGFAFWSQRSAEGETLRDIAEDFYYSDEFQARIGSTSHEDLVRSFYVDLLGREPEEEGFNFWVGQLANDERSAANVAQSILESDEFRENIDTLLNRNDWLDVL